MVQEPGKAGHRVKVAILWTRLSGYLNACLKELAGRDGVELFVSHQMPSGDAPFDDRQFGWMTNRLPWRSSTELDGLEQRLRAFAPDILIFAGWHIPAYRTMAKAFANQCWRVMTMDNCWMGTLRQRMSTLIARFYLHPLADAVWLPGERQAVFARKLGFSQRIILRGLYSCDQPAIEVPHLTRLAEGRAVPRSFLFVGRFVSEKGIDTLAEAYRAYRQATVNPWPLICCGAGPLHSRLTDKPGIQIEGFVQPEQLAALVARAGCLVLPSAFEPWAVVVHEAASAGLLVLASENVGAALHLVQPDYNGFIFAGGDVEGLALLMSRVSAMSNAQLDGMSRNSYSLSRQFSPRRWADTLLQFHAGPQKSKAS